MRIECSSIPKFRDLSQPGDDVLLVLPQRLYAVLDGATDTIGSLVQGMPPGRFAASRAALALTQCAMQQTPGTACPANVLLKAMNQAIADGLVQAGARGVKASTTAMVVQDAGDTLEFLVVGDSGVRINGTELIHLTKDVDRLYAQARSHVFALLKTKGLEGDALEAAARKLVMRGLAQSDQTLASESEIAHIIQQTQFACARWMKSDAINLVANMLNAGIAGGQYDYENKADHSLGYAVINGGNTQGSDMLSFTRAKSSIQSLELFTDGYFTLPQGTHVRDWEAAFFKGEEDDFSKSGVHAAIKGSTTQFFSDDRTVVTLHFAG